jgi:hypothetical protein
MEAASCPFALLGRKRRRRVGFWLEESQGLLEAERRKFDMWLP